jgi:hypothetical protein
MIVYLYFKDKKKEIENSEKNVLFLQHFNVFFIKKRTDTPI